MTKNQFMQFMIIEHFKNQDAIPVYRRFRDEGRLAPEGLNYISSWVDIKMEKCFQIMETNEEALIYKWIDNWKDIVEFEVFPIMSSKDSYDKISPLL